MPREHFLPILPFERIAKKAGIARLSRDGAEELREAVEETAISIAEQATRVAFHAGRKTVIREDIEFVTGKAAQPRLQTQQLKKPETRKAPLQSS